MKKLCLLLALFALHFSCKSDSQQNKEGAETAQTAEIATTSIKFICQAAQDPNIEAGAPQHEVFLQMGDSRIKVGDILACETISKELYEQYRIPANAIDAAGGWWAGAGDYFYVAEENGKYVVKQGEMFEEKTDNAYDYKTIMTFSKDGKEVF